MKQLVDFKFLALVLLIVLAFGSAWAQKEGLHLIFNVNDDQDLYPADTGRTMGEALDRQKPEQIDSDAEWYFVQLEAGSSIESLGLPVKGAKTAQRQVSAGASVSEAVSGNAQAKVEEMGDSGWIELEAYSASVYYWSETGEGESSWQPGKFRMFIRRLADAEIVVAIGPGPVPPGD